MLEPLSAQQIEQIGGGYYYYNDQVAPEPNPPVYQEPPFPPQRNPLPQ